MVETLGLRYKKGVYPQGGVGGGPPFEENKIDGEFLFEKISITNSQTMNNTLNETNFNETKFNMQSAISPRGTVMKMLDGEGFSLHDCISELEDNKQGAKATKSIYLLDRNTNQLVSIDNGKGMTKPGLVSCHVLNNRKSVSKDSQNKFGNGGKYPLVIYTQCKASTIALSKQKDGELNQLEAEWNKAVKEDQYFPQAHEASKKWDEFWQNNAIDQEQGTMFIIPCTPEQFDLLDMSIQDTSSKGIRAVFGRAYAKQLQAGQEICFIYTDSKELFLVPTIDVLNYAETPDHMKRTVELAYFCSPENKNDGLTCIKTAAGEYEMVADCDAKQLKRIPAIIPENYQLLSSMTLQTVVAFEPEPNVAGGIYFDRQAKITGHYKHNDNITHFTAAQQKTIITCSRSKLAYDSDMDAAAATETNKSNIKFANVNHRLKKTVELLHNDFCKITHRKYHPSNLLTPEEKAQQAAEEAQKEADKKAEKAAAKAEKKAQQEAAKAAKAEKKAQEEADKAEAKLLKELKKNKLPKEELWSEIMQVLHKFRKEDVLKRIEEDQWVSA